MLPQQLEELKNHKLWINYIRIWNQEKHGGAGGYDKPPINPLTCYDGKVNSAGAETWTTYDLAAANVGKTATHYDTKHKDAQGRAPMVRASIEGVGLVMAGGVAGVDFDDVLNEEGKIRSWALPIIKRLDTYTEISPSGRGLHCILFCGDLLTEGADDFGSRFPLDAAGNITDDASKASDLELYFYKHGGRYLTFTGRIFWNRPINHTKGQELKQIYEEFKTAAAAYRASKWQAQAAEVRHNSPGQQATGEDDRKMVSSALAAIDPGALDFGEWAAVMTALKVLGYGLDYAQDWSAGNLCGSVNAKNNPDTNARRWPKFSFKRGDDRATGIIINTAKKFNWRPAEAFEDEARTQYGRKLYTDQQRTEYGRTQHTDEERREYGRKLHTDEERAEYGRNLYTEDQRKEYGRKKHLERISKINALAYGRKLRERAASQQDAARIQTSNPKHYTRKNGDD